MASHPARQAGDPAVRTRPRDWRPLLGVTLWTFGLLLSLVFGIVSAYVVLSALFVGSRVLGWIRARVAGDGGGST